MVIYHFQIICEIIDLLTCHVHISIVFCQILETIPISDEVSDLVQKLGNFYTEVDIEGEETEENEVDRRAFTRPFAKHAGNVRV